MVQSKTCTCCNVEKDFESFSNDKQGKYGLKAVCRVCVTINRKPYEKEYRLREKEARATYNKNNPVMMRASRKKWRENNKGHVNSLTAKRHANQNTATPSWANLNLIKDIYQQASHLTLTTGIQHHVDHIIPLQGKTVSGLHVEYNLQILTATENLKKSNKLLGEYLT